MAGSGAGLLLAGRFRSKRWTPRTAYVAAELAIGGGALLATATLLLSPLPSSVLGNAATPAARTSFDIACAAALTLLPAVSIGATYPLLVQTAVLGREESGRVGGIYLAGLAGGLAGVLLTATAVGPRRGLDVASVVAASANLVLAVLARMVLRPGRWEDGEPLPPEKERWLGPVGLFAAAGTIGLGGQVVWNRVVVPYAGVSIFSFGLIVAAYLFAQSLGMALSRRLGRERAEDAGRWGLVLAVPVALLGFEFLTRIEVPVRDSPVLWWTLSTSLVVLLVVGPAAFLLGVSQGGALRVVESREAGWGRAAGRVVGIGTIASAVSGVLAVLVLLPAIGPRFAFAALAFPACLVLLGSGRRASSFLAVAGTLLALLARPGPKDFLGRSYDDLRVVHVDHGVEATVAIVQFDHPLEPGLLRLTSGGVAYAGDSLFAQRYMRLLGHLPALAARGEERALVLCVGTGTTAAALLPYLYTEIDLVDINPSIRDALPFFRRVNDGLERDERVRFVVEDGLRFLRLGGKRYDVITLEPPPPRAPGASSLYCREFYDAARARLAEGGVLAQWLPIHDVSRWEMDLVLRTFLDAFPEATLHIVERNEAILLGSVESHRTERPRERRDRSGVRRDLSAIGLADLDPLGDTFVAGREELDRRTGAGEILRYAWPAPEYAPLSGPRGAEPLDRWAEDLFAISPVRGEPTTGAVFLDSLAAFLRVQENRGRQGDERKVLLASIQILVFNPDDPYFQYLNGFGKYLERRLDRLAQEGYAPDLVQGARELIEENRLRAERVLERRGR
ncbi:MAG: hypothetical protein HY720_32810 [Planctomycetes bacterium]|nr:hypothetical protein [Planctomycetota bacterium]